MDIMALRGCPHGGAGQLNVMQQVSIMSETIASIQLIEFLLFLFIHLLAAISFGYIVFRFSKCQFQTRNSIWLGMGKRLLAIFLLEKVPSYFPALSKLIYPSSIWASQDSGIGLLIGAILFTPLYYLALISTIAMAMTMAASLQRKMRDSEKAKYGELSA